MIRKLENTMIETLKLLADYNMKADAAMMKILSALPEESLRKDLGTFFKSIADTLLHAAAAEIIWLKRFKGFLRFECLGKSPLPGMTNEELMDICAKDLRSFFTLKGRIDELYIALVAEIRAEDLGRRIRYTSVSGREMEKTFWHTIMQVLNHGTHHRGAISAMLDILKVYNDYSGIVLYTE